MTQTENIPQEAVEIPESPGLANLPTEKDTPAPSGLKERINKAVSDYREWLALPYKNRTMVPVAENELDKVQNALMEYRLILVKFTYRAIHIDTEIWSNYNWAFNEFSRLKAETRKNLRFKRLAHLRKLYQDWQTLSTRQADLLAEIRRAPASFEFYDKMMVRKQSRRSERKLDEELSQKFTKAYQLLESAIEYVEKFNRENDVSIFGASVLRIESAREYWEERLNYIHQLEAARADPEKILAEINKLKDAMYAAPAVSKWIHDVEQRFNRLKFDHELLVNSYGKAVIPDQEISENTSILGEMIPRLWATGQREQLDHYLRILEQFLSIYESEVQSELTYAERHDMKRQAEGGSQVTGQQQGQNFQQLIDLTKILVSAIESREPTMANHSLMVSRLSVAVGREMNWSENEIRSLEIAALLHDVGKIWIPESILAKEEDLSQEDIELLKKHPLYGAQLLESFDSFKEIAPWIYYHQERWDGKGYPEGLSGEEIPIASRIIAVAESYNAMTSGHNNRRAMTAQAAMTEIRAEAGQAYDPRIVEFFAKVMENAKY